MQVETIFARLGAEYSATNDKVTASVLPASSIRPNASVVSSGRVTIGDPLNSSNSSVEHGLSAD